MTYVKLNSFRTLVFFFGGKIKMAIKFLTCLSLTLSTLSGCGSGSTHVESSASEESVGNDDIPTPDAPIFDAETDRQLPEVERPVAEPETANKKDAQEDKLKEPGIVKIEDQLAGTLVLIPAGKFLMGTLDSEDESFAMERPQHVVQIENEFYIGMHEVTFEQFRRFVGATGYVTDAEKDGLGGSGFDSKKQDFINQGKQFSWRNTGFPQKDRNPVVNVSWNDAVAYCHWLTSRNRNYNFRLPTEAEREYVGRAGTTTPYGWGVNPESMIQFENVADQSLFNKISPQSVIRRLCGNWSDGFSFTAPVGSFPPNAFGLNDTHGNVGEWCQDVFLTDRYLKSAEFVSQTGDRRVFRGGTFLYRPGACRVARRFALPPDTKKCDLGFRVVRNVAPIQRQQPLANSEPVELKLKVPSDREIELSRRLIQKIYVERHALVLKLEENGLIFLRKSEKGRFAKMFLKDAFESDHEPAELYALLDEAIQYSIEAGEYRVALSAIREIRSTFSVNLNERLIGIMEKSQVNTRAPSIEFIALSLDLTDQAVRFGNLDMAHRLLMISQKSLSKRPVTKWIELVSQKEQDLEILTMQEKKVALQIKKLKEDDADLSANLDVGSYFCFVLTNWDEGLPLLVKSGNQTLAKLAERDLEGSSDAAGRMMIGDSWLLFSEQYPGIQQAHILDRAIFWYERSRTNMTDAQIITLDERLKTADRTLESLRFYEKYFEDE